MSGRDMNKYLIDTNILVYFWDGKIPEEEVDKIASILKHSFDISIITKMEFLGWRQLDENGFKKAKEFLERAAIIHLDDNIADLVITLKRYGKIKLPDAIIAATALVNGYVLVTRNEEDFVKISELEIYNPCKHGSK
jgi:predicted nucleic acid-binding protein